MGDTAAGLGRSQDGAHRRLGDVSTRAEFGALLTALRLRSGSSLRELAARAGSSPSTLSGWCRAENLPFPAQDDVFRTMLESLGVDDVDAWMDALIRVRETGTGRSTCPAPYRGLQSFTEAEADWFFGRSELLDDAHRRLCHLLADAGRPNLLILVGASGCGKSSVLHAGLCPRLAGDGAAWLSLTPGPEPTAHLVAVLAEHFGEDATVVSDALHTDPCGWLASMAPSTGAQAVDLAVVVDQFEELFTVCDDASERDRFLELLGAVASSTGRCAVVIGLRIDFYADLVATGHLTAALQDAQVLVGPMNVTQLTQAITAPARAAGRSVDDDLVALLLRDFLPSGSLVGRHDAGALPLLSHALLETWDRARKGRLTVADYHAAGGLQGAVEQSAEQIYERLPAADQALARQVFLRLVHVGSDAVATRRAASYAELAGLAGATRDEATEQSTATADLLGRFVSARLLTAHESTVEITHESLLLAWPRLRGWIEQSRDALRVHRKITEAAQLWTEHDHDPSTLARGARLEEMRSLAESESTPLRLNPAERDFITASVEREAAAAAEEKRRTIRLRALAGIAIVFGVLAGSLAMVTEGARSAAVTARDEALSRQIALTAERLRSTDSLLAAQLAVAGFGVASTSEARSALLDSAALPIPTRALGGPGSTALAVSGNGLAAWSNATDGTVQLIDLGEHARTGMLVPDDPDAEIYALAFTPDDRILAVGDTAAAVGLWDLSDPRNPRRLGEALRGPTGPVQRIAVSPDGSELAAVGTGEGVYRWDIQDPAAPVALPTLPVPTTTWNVVYSPDRTHLAVSDDVGGVHVWDVDGEPTRVVELSLDDRQVTALAFSPDGAALAGGSRSGLLGVWDLSDPAAPAPLEVAADRFDSWVNAAAFSPDGRHLVAGSSDLDLRAWETTSWTHTETLRHPAAITQAAFSPDGQALVTAATDGTLRVWDPAALVGVGQSASVWNLVFRRDSDSLAAFSGAESGLWDIGDPSAPQPLGDPVTAPTELAFTGAGSVSPDGTVLAHGTVSGEIVLIDVTDPDDPVLAAEPFGEPTGLVEAVVFSPDGALLAAGGNDSAVRVWDMSTPSRPRRAGLVEGLGPIVLNLAWHPDEPWLAAPSADGHVYLLDLSDPDNPSVLTALDGFDSEAYAAAFHPDGDAIATAGSDTTVIVWDISDPRAPRRVGEPLTGPPSRIFSLSFHPRGWALAAAVGDGTTWVWDTRDQDRPVRHAVLGPADGQAHAVRFGPRGDLLAGSGADGRLRLWPTDEQSLIDRICTSVGDPMTAQEWATYVPGRAFDPPCPM